MKKQRVVLCTYHGLVSSTVLAQLLSCSSIEVVGIIRSTRLFSPRYNSFTGSVKMIRDSGWRYSLFLFFMTDVSHALSPISALKSVDQLAKIHSIPVYKTNDINTLESIQWIKSLMPDYLLSAYFNQKIKSSVLLLPTIKSLNIHPSILPSFQGVDPFFYMLLRGKKMGGVSLHQMNEYFDEGPLIDTHKISLSCNDNVMSLTIKAYQQGACLFCNYINKSNHKPILNQLVNRHYDSWPRPFLVALFSSMKLKLWTFKTLFNYLFKLKNNC